MLNVFSNYVRTAKIVKTTTKLHGITSILLVFYRAVNAVSSEITRILSLLQPLLLLLFED